MPRIDLIQIRGGTTEQWTNANPVLQEREPGLNTDTGEVKYGDGVTAWADLPYPSGGSDFLRLELSYNGAPIEVPDDGTQTTVVFDTLPDGVTQDGDQYQIPPGVWSAAFDYEFAPASVTAPMYGSVVFGSSAGDPSFGFSVAPIIVAPGVDYNGTILQNQGLFGGSLLFPTVSLRAVESGGDPALLEFAELVLTRVGMASD